MSSFIPSAKHFKSIEKTFIELHSCSDFYYPYKLKKSFPTLYDNGSAESMLGELKDVIDALAELTVLCVCLQYKSDYEGMLDKEIEQQTTAVKTKVVGNTLSRVGLFKALSCVNYQIELEHLKELRALSHREKKAVKFLRVMIGSLAEWIVKDLPSYENEKWDQ